MDSTFSTGDTIKGSTTDNTAGEASQKVCGFMKTACDTISQTKNNLAKEICNKPVQSSLIALGAGFLLSALLRR